MFPVSESQSESMEQNSVSHFYCSGCNEILSDDAECCTRCGMLSSRTLSNTLDTVLLPHDPFSTGVFPTTLEVDDLLLDGQTVQIYKCGKLLGRGGMGVVYLARNVKLHRQCALKVLSPRRVSQSIDYVERFQNEGRAAAALVHPNVVTTHAIGIEGDHHFLEMEYVPGQSLQKEIERSGPIGPIRATQMAVGIAEGLAAAHRIGIIHRDLKPDNILVTPAGYPKIADFGLAKTVLTGQHGDVRLAGTPSFMAPELFEGQSASPASDVFALGVCYYLMLTGKLPFESESINGLINSVMTGKCVSVRRLNPDIPLDIAECVGLMMARSPQNRPPDGAGVSQLLQAVLGSVRDLHTLVHEAFAHMPSATWQDDGHRVRVQLNLNSGRQQTVYIENSDHPAGDRLLLIYSVCCEARTDFYEEALRLNAVVRHGGLAIRELDGRQCFVMVDTYPRATVSGEEIRRSVVEVGSQADSIEDLLTGDDVN